MPHPEIIRTLQAGDTLLLDDGKLRFTVLRAAPLASEGAAARVECRVEIGGALSDRKGVNTPSITLPISPLTPKDRADLTFALALGVDWVALRCAESWCARPLRIPNVSGPVWNGGQLACCRRNLSLGWCAATDAGTAVLARCGV
jgi:pyruvate kinase